jgi:ATP-dependent 26S proteasome regulatory subunit
MQTNPAEKIVDIPSIERSKSVKSSHKSSKIDKIKKDTAYKLVKILVLDQPEDNQKHTVWMHSHDVKELFGTENIKECYVRIVNRAYKIGIRNIQAGYICISNRQKMEIRSEVSSKNGTDSVIVSSFWLNDHKIELNSVTLKIEFHNFLNKKAVYDYEDLEQRCKKILVKSVVNLNQTFLLDCQNENITLLVKSLIFTPQIAEKFKGSFGLVTKNTLLRFENANSDKITFISRTKNDVIEHCSFSFRVNEAPRSPFFFQLSEYGESYVVPYQNFIKAIHNQFDHTQLFENLKGKIIINEQPFKFTIDFIKGSIPQPPPPSGCRRAMFLSPFTKLHLSSVNDEVIFVGNKLREANECYFKVTDIVNTKKHPKTNQYLTPWVNSNELKLKLKGKKQLAVGQQFKVTLTTGTFILKLEDAGSYSEDSVVIANDEKGFKSLWFFNENSNFTFSVDQALNIKIVNEINSLPIQKILFEVLQYTDLQKNGEEKAEVLEADLEQAIQNEAPVAIVTGQAIQVSIREQVFLLTVKDMLFSKKINDVDVNHLGALKYTTVCQFVSNKNNQINIIPKKKSLNQETLLASLKEMKIGGMKDQIQQLIRRVAIFQDADLANEVAGFGLKPLKGIVLHGPPGTGKTMLARELGKLLGCQNVQLVSSPEIFNKFLGNSEKKIRKIFEGAERMQEKYGSNSPLNLIIFDEFDAIASKRSDKADYWMNTIVDQLLTCIDGLKELNNILVIGITNRLDALDPAIIRAGRLEYHLEIGLPDLASRLEIFEIYTKDINSNKRLSKDVDLKFLAKKTEGFSGADIEGVLRTAVSYPLDRLFINKGAPEVEKAAIKMLTQADLLKALKEVSLNRKKEESPIPDGMYT